jgi:hypothetical protein
MSSSNRTTLPFEAAIYRNDKPVGPMRLPAKEKMSFVQEFNRVYRDAGIALQPEGTGSVETTAQPLVARSSGFATR